MSILDNTADLRALLKQAKALPGGSSSGGDNSGESDTSGSGLGGYGGTGEYTLSISTQISDDADCQGEPCYGHHHALAVTINSGTTMYFSSEPYCEYRGDEGVIRHTSHVVNLDNLSYEDTVVITTCADGNLYYGKAGCSVERESDDTYHVFTITNFEENASFTLVYIY